LHDIDGLPFWKKVLAGATAGSIGAAIATPTDVLKVLALLNEAILIIIIIEAIHKHVIRFVCRLMEQTIGLDTEAHLRDSQL